MQQRPVGMTIRATLLALALLLGGCGARGAGPTSVATRAAANDPAVAYCTSTGGRVVSRYPVYGTNGPNPLRLAGSLPFCQYTAADGSRIHIALTTLYAEQPSLAVLAYRDKPSADQAPPGVNPASVYCTQLGGSDQFGGVGLSGGGWVTDDESLVDQVLQACIFPDLSTIDSFGLWYHTNGAIRGIDLATVVRYKPDSPPATPSAR